MKFSIFRKILIFATFIAISATFHSCETYPEGSLSFYSSEYRIVNSWQVSHTFLNGTEITETEYHGYAPQTYYYIYADHVLMLMARYNGEYRESSFATWVLDAKAKTIKFDYTFLGKRYLFTADIKKLSRKEFIFEFDDENGDHWRIQMFSRYDS